MLEPDTTQLLEGLSLAYVAILEEALEEAAASLPRDPAALDRRITQLGEAGADLTQLAAAMAVLRRRTV